jgi:hypothetical protein
MVGTVIWMPNSGRPQDIIGVATAVENAPFRLDLSRFRNPRFTPPPARISHAD